MMARKKKAIPKTPAIAFSPDGYLPCGNLRKAWAARHRNMMIGGPYGTGKTRFGFERFNLYMCSFPNSVGVLARKTYDDLVPLVDIIISISPEANLSLWHANRFVNPYFWFEFDNPEDTRTIEAVDRWMEMFINYYGGFDTIVAQAVSGLFTRGSLFAEMVFDSVGGGLLEPVDLLVRDPIWVRFQKQDDAKRGRVWHYGQWRSPCCDGTYQSDEGTRKILCRCFFTIGKLLLV